MIVLAAMSVAGSSTVLRADAPATMMAASANQADRPIVGAIRWDAWAGDQGTASQAVHRCLGPEKWHYRLPFYAKVTGEDTVVIDGTPQSVMDQEIKHAAAAALDYWAFVTYSAEDPISIALQRYLSSRMRSKINFCLITECTRWRQKAYADRVASMLTEPGYQHVLGRPLLYVGFIDEKRLKPFGGIEGFRKVLDEFRADLTGKGVPEPYIVIMDFQPTQGKQWMDALGGDAISSYVAGTGQGVTPYQQVTRNVEQFWNRCRETGAHVVPIVTTGWDPRPRTEIPVPWGNPYSTHNGEVNRSELAKPEEIARQVGIALDWLAAHRDAAPAQAVIIYAWNEFDEGGWLAPTLAEGTARLDAIGRVLAGPRVTATRPTTQAGGH